MSKITFTDDAGNTQDVALPDGMDGAIAKLLYAAADEMAFRSAPLQSIKH